MKPITRLDWRIWGIFIGGQRAHGVDGRDRIWITLHLLCWSIAICAWTGKEVIDPEDR